MKPKIFMQILGFKRRSRRRRRRRSKNNRRAENTGKGKWNIQRRWKGVKKRRKKKRWKVK